MKYGNDIVPERRAETVDVEVLLEEESTMYELVTGENLTVVFDPDRLSMFEAHTSFALPPFPASLKA